MNSHTSAAALAIGTWDDEGGAPVGDATERYYGRRVESDRSWTVHHVFTGVPAHIDGVTLAGLSRADATDVMLKLNRRSVLQKRERKARLRAAPAFAEIASQPCP